MKLFDRTELKNIRKGDNNVSLRCFLEIGGFLFPNSYEVLYFRYFFFTIKYFHHLLKLFDIIHKYLCGLFLNNGTHFMKFII